MHEIELKVLANINNGGNGWFDTDPDSALKQMIQKTIDDFVDRGFLNTKSDGLTDAGRSYYEANNVPDDNTLMLKVLDHINSGMNGHYASVEIGRLHDAISEMIVKCHELGYIPEVSKQHNFKGRYTMAVGKLTDAGEQKLWDLKNAITSP